MTPKRANSLTGHTNTSETGHDNEMDGKPGFPCLTLVVRHGQHEIGVVDGGVRQHERGGNDGGQRVDVADADEQENDDGDDDHRADGNLVRASL